MGTFHFARNQQGEYEYGIVKTNKEKRCIQDWKERNRRDDSGNLCWRLKEETHEHSLLETSPKSFLLMQGAKGHIKD